MVRKKISLSDSTMDVLNLMSEGNMGAAKVLTDIIKKKGLNDGILFILHFDDMNMRGAQIWTAYKICHENLDVFIKNIEERNEEMVKALNNKMQEYGFEHKAVCSGASFEQEREI